MNQQDDFSFVEPDPNENIKDPKTGKTISRKRAYILAGGAMAAGSALNDLIGNDDIPEIILDSDSESAADTPLTDTGDNGVYQEPAEHPDEPEMTGSPAQQAWNPNTAPVAPQGVINDDMSFSEAFSAAREELGAGGVFAWQGQYYNTFYAEELDDNNQPVVEYEVTGLHDLETLDQYDSSPAEEEPIEQENQDMDDELLPHVMAVDFDMDGNVDAVYVDLNQDGSADGVYTDINQDGQITEEELTFIHDPDGLSVPEATQDGSMMSVDTDADGIDDILLADMDGDQYADVLGIDENMDQQIGESEVFILNPDAMEGTDFGAAPVDYSGEISSDMPEDVSDDVLDEMTDDLANLEDSFDEINKWS